MHQAPKFHEAAAPDWLADVVRLRRAPVPWPAMVRAGIAISVPLAIAFAAGQRGSGVLIAMGGLLGTGVDRAGSYAARVKRVSSAAVFGGATGLAIGSLIHDRGWIAVAALVIVAGLSALLSAVSDVASVTGLQLLIYTSLGLGPLGAERPWWHTAVGFVLGTAWALLLTVPGWLLSPHAAEQRSVAGVYNAVAAQLAAVGTRRFAKVRRSVTAAFNTAYDSLLTTRLAAAGRDRRMARLVVLLNQANLVTEAATTLDQEGNRPPPQVIDTVSSVADAIRDDRALVIAAPPWGTSPGARALRDAVAGVAHLVKRKAVPPTASLGAGPRLADRAAAVRDRAAGRLTRTFSLRLMACICVAAVISEVLPLARSYWVVLTVAIVLKPDFGSVFARAVQRGIGTILGAVLGAVILAAVPYGPWLLIPFGALAALLPYGQARNYGLYATFLTPLVVVLVDLLTPAGWHLALDRLLDTLVGCGVVLLVGYAPWPDSWHAHLPTQFAQAIRDVCRYLNTALLAAAAGSPTDCADGAKATDAQKAAADGPDALAEQASMAGSGLPRRSRLRRQASRALADLRAQFQRAMSEPAAASRRATAWWPALVGLEEVMDAVTSAAVAVSRGGPAPSSEAVRELSAILGAAARTVKGTARKPVVPELPSDEPLKPVTEAVHAVLTVLSTEKPPGTPGSAPR